MSLDKAIQHGKEHRERYYGCKSFDKTCRNHGSDDWMKNNRTFDTIKNKMSKKDMLNNLDGWDGFGRKDK